MSFSIILLFPTSFICGFSYYPADEQYRYDQFNLYLFLLQFQITWYEEDFPMV